jgi:hypothetical protein
MRRVIFLAVLLFAHTGARAADSFSSQELLESLNGRGMGQSFAYGYILGAMSGLNKAEGVCYPDGVTNGQVSAMTKKYLEDHPEHWNVDARFGVWAALLGAWPCKPAKT